MEEPAAFAGGAKGVRIQPGLAASVKGAPARTLDPIVQESAQPVGGQRLKRVLASPSDLFRERQNL